MYAVLHACVIARRRTQGFDGIAVGGAGPQVNLDWTGSGDDTHHGYAIGTRPTVAIATFDKDGTASFVNGCEESNLQGHLENALATMVGARADPASEYGRFFIGTIHELQASSNWPSRRHRVPVSDQAW